MALPVLTPEQEAQLAVEKAKQLDYAATMTNSLAAKQKRIEELTLTDSAFKTFFDFYNDDVIGKYEAERKWLDGKYISAPILETDIIAAASIQANRLTPTLPQTDIIRVDEFDGTPLVQDPDNYEQLFIAKQAVLEDQLVNGFSGPTDLTTETTTTLAANSTTLELSNTSALVLNEDDFLVIVGSSQVAVVVITSVTDTSVLPDYSYTLGINVIVPPTTTISAGANLGEFLGFTNSERTTKTAVDPDMQPLMDYFTVSLSNEINNRIDTLDGQLTALNANQDPENDVMSAKTDVQTSKTFLENYLVSLPISDVGLTDLSNERIARSSDIVSRITTIETNASSFYDRRYDQANNRANSSRGTLRMQKATEASLAVTQDLIASAQDQVAAFDSLG